jgi:hypothetical protein
VCGKRGGPLAREGGLCMASGCTGHHRAVTDHKGALAVLQEAMSNTEPMPTVTPVSFAEPVTREWLDEIQALASDSGSIPRLIAIARAALTMHDKTAWGCEMWRRDSGWNELDAALRGESPKKEGR